MRERGRRVPPQPRDLEAAERLNAILSGDPARVRAWAATHIPDDLNTFALATDDEIRATLQSVFATLVGQ